jgi:hypothetical protein
MAKTITPAPARADSFDFDEIDRAVKRAHHMRSEAFTSVLRSAYHSLFGKRSAEETMKPKGFRDCTSPA